MSRKSTASLSVVPIGVASRMAIPADLTPEEGRLWADTVASKPADWFQASDAPMLKEFVRAAMMCDLLAVQIEAALVGSELAERRELMKLRDMESKRLASIMTKLRLTQQSRYTPQAAATADKKAGNARPWTFGKS